MSAPSLEALGWSAHFEEAFAPYEGDGFVPARVAVQHRGAYVVCAETGELSSEPTGRLHHETGPGGLPVAGDWVVIRPHEDGFGAIIHAVLPRRTSISRKAACLTTEEQVLGANIDVVFLVAGLDGDLNARRLERYLSTVWNSGAEPVVVLSKADLCDDLEAALASVAGVAIGVSVHVASGLTGEGVDELLHISPAIARLPCSARPEWGSRRSSTVFAARTCRRSPMSAATGAAGTRRRPASWSQLPGGGLLLDTPGMRELQLWDVNEGFGTTFDDVESLAAECRFNDCSHDGEPGCAVQSALVDGSLERERYASYTKLQRELRALAIKQDKRLQADERKARRRFGRAQRHPKRW